MVAWNGVGHGVGVGGGGGRGEGYRVFRNRQKLGCAAEAVKQSDKFGSNCLCLIVGIKCLYYKLA